MIITSLNSSRYEPSQPNAILRAFLWLKENKNKIEKMQPGKYCIEGEDMYAKVFDVKTKKLEDTKPEIHKKYIDVQYWQNGEELMGYAPYTDNVAIIEENSDEDLYFLENPENEVFLPAHAGDIMVLFPEDIHRPAVCKNESINCRKVVIKVSLSLL